MNACNNCNETINGNYCSNIIFFLTFLFLLSACNNYNDNSQAKKWMNNTEELRMHNKGKISITEGIWGTLVRTEGNCMPFVGGGYSSCKQYPVQREIEIYEYTTWDETRHSSNVSSFFEKVYTKRVATVTCDLEGFFELKLSPGKYSVFVKEQLLLYAKLSDGYGGINPITIESGKVSEVILNIDYAVY